MADFFANHSSGLDSPATRAFAIVPDDNNDLAVIPRALYTGRGGSIVLALLDDVAEVTLLSVPAGIVLPLRARRVKATGTTATDMVGLA